MDSFITDMVTIAGFALWLVTLIAILYLESRGGL